MLFFTLTNCFCYNRIKMICKANFSIFRLEIFYSFFPLFPILLVVQCPNEMLQQVETRHSQIERRLITLPLFRKLSALVIVPGCEIGICTKTSLTSTCPMSTSHLSIHPFYLFLSLFTQTHMYSLTLSSSLHLLFPL